MGGGGVFVDFKTGAGAGSDCEFCCCTGAGCTCRCMIAVVRGWGVSGHEWLDVQRGGARASKTNCEDGKSGRKQEGVGHATR